MTYSGVAAVVEGRIATPFPAAAAAGQRWQSASRRPPTETGRSPGAPTNHK